MFNRIRFKSDEDIELIKRSSLLVGKTLAEVAKHILPGVPLKFLDKIGEEFIRDHGGTPSFKGYEGFPSALCLSLNDVVVHGIPNMTVLEDGDILSVDCGVYMNGYHGDYAYTFAVGNISEDKRLLIERTKNSLYKGIDVAKVGNTTGHIGAAVQNYVEQFGYGVVRELCGHGIGKELHEKPDVCNYGRPGDGPRLQTGMVICIEPMITMGKRKITCDHDGWTMRTADHKPAAHFEHQVAFTTHGTEILSTYKYIAEVLGSEEKY
ncbi:MAG: type I methionyl aminopeptidase [Bacteroidales bacterium]|jgi:methionyl aminopeptidase|nr:type I methionyl aminopeptidase [Bacteroidales bacterium]